MQKGDISGRFNTLRNRGKDDDTGVRWVSSRLGKIRNVLVIAGIAFCFVYGYYWFKKHGEKLKTPCQRAFETNINGKVLSVFLDENSKGVVTLRVLQNTGDTIEYFTGRGGHKDAGRYIKSGYRVEKQPGSFDLKVTDDNNRVKLLKAEIKNCE